MIERRSTSCLFKTELHKEVAPAGVALVGVNLGSVPLKLYP